MTKRVTVTITFEAHEYHISSDYYDAKDEVEVQARQFGGQFGEVKRVSVSLVGWAKPSYERMD